MFSTHYILKVLGKKCHTLAPLLTNYKPKALDTLTLNTKP